MPPFLFSAFRKLVSNQPNAPHAHCGLFVGRRRGEFAFSGGIFTADFPLIRRRRVIRKYTVSVGKEQFTKKRTKREGLFLQIRTIISLSHAQLSRFQGAIRDSSTFSFRAGDDKRRGNNEIQGVSTWCDALCGASKFSRNRLAVAL